MSGQWHCGRESRKFHARVGPKKKLVVVILILHSYQYRMDVMMMVTPCSNSTLFDAVTLFLFTASCWLNMAIYVLMD